MHSRHSRSALVFHNCTRLSYSSVSRLGISKHSRCAMGKAECSSIERQYERTYRGKMRDAHLIWSLALFVLVLLDFHIMQWARRQG